MAIKYTCPKCNRRFTQWGAEKVGFKCPNDEWRPKDHPDDVELVRLGPSEDRPTRRPTLKKGARKLAVALPAGYGDESTISDVGDMESAAEFQDTDANLEDAETDDEEITEDEVTAEGPDESAVEVEVESTDTDLGDDALDIDDEDGEAGEETEETTEDEWQE